MIRGRHRGLPVAIDRAVMFPREYQDSESGTSDLDDPEQGTQFDTESVSQTASQTRAFSSQRELRRTVTKTLTPIRTSKPAFPGISESDEVSYIQAHQEGGDSFSAKIEHSSRFKNSRPRPRTGSVDSSRSRSDASSFISYHRSDASSSADFADNEEPRSGASANDNHSVILSIPKPTTLHD